MFALLKDNKSIIQEISKLNWKFIFAIMLLALVGFTMLYSAAGGHIYPWLAKQLIFFAIFFPLMLLIAIIDIRFWLHTSYLYYGIALILIIAVDIMGHSAMGATRWFKVGGLALQPSEIMKVSLVLALSRYFYQKNAADIGKIKFSIVPILMILIPTYFVFDQPDLGTATILLLVGAATLFIAGVKAWKFIVAGACALVAIPFLWIFVFYDYQKERILNFLNPDNDPLGTGYNIIQSKIAIGSGGVFGKGFLNGTQGQLDFLPEKQTDFIFTMLSEELGFIGCVLTIILYATIIFMGTQIAFRARHQFGKLLVIGVMNILFIHVFINMGMVMGLLPVVGAPLPLISYGGTITASMLIGFGFVLNVDKNSDAEDIR